VRRAFQILVLSLAAWALCCNRATAQSVEALLDKLIQKGVLTEKEAQDLKAESTPSDSTNQPAASKWKLNDTVKSIQLYGDLRFRYEARSAENVPGSGGAGDSYLRERFRYAARIGLKGDLFDDFNYGFRLDTSSNPRSAWITFGDDSSPSPFAKNSDTVNIGQIFLRWHPYPWLDLTIGKMPQPLYTTSMVWDGDFSPEGLAEHLHLPARNIDFFANFGQFVYQDTNPDFGLPSSDTLLLAFQAGAEIKFAEEIKLKVAPVFYAYTRMGRSGGLNGTFTGEGFSGINTNNAAPFNNAGINNLKILEVPGEISFGFNHYTARVFEDFAYNFDGRERAEKAAAAGLLPSAFPNDTKAWMAGISFGNSAPGLVNGSVSRRNSWEAKAYWQYVEQYSLDVNLLDSDFFEGRANLEGVYGALAYGLTDSIVATMRYGYANRINHHLDTGGTNPDLPILNPIRNYHLVQLDLSYRF
jgi:hypothetical protein